MKQVSSSSSALDRAVGSLEWGERTRGVLTDVEKGQLVENVKFLFNQETLDADRRRLGLLNPHYIAIADLIPPDTKIVRDSAEYVVDLYTPTLLRHVWRTYYFGALISMHDGVRFDRELGFSASMLHDLGLTPTADPQPSESCFAVNGGIHARDFLLGKGHNHAHADIVGHAVSVHLNYHVPHEEHGDTAFLVTRGAICDVFGTGASRIAEASVKEVLGLYPRDELYTVFNDTAFEHLRDTRFEASFRAVRNGDVEVIAHPLDRPPYA